MKKVLAFALAGIGVLAAGAASVACSFFVIDEPEMPKTMIER